MTIFIVAIAVGAIIVVSVLAFPFLGLAFLPVFVLAFLALIGWAYTFIRRGPRGLPERTTSPSEPELDKR